MGQKVTKDIHIWVRPYDLIPMRKSVHNGIRYGSDPMCGKVIIAAEVEDHMRFFVSEV